MAQAGSLERLYRIRERLALLNYLKMELEEIEEARRIAEKSSTGRAYIGAAGGNVLIEVPVEEALKYLERRRIAIESLVKRLEEEIRRELPGVRGL